MQVCRKCNSKKIQIFSSQSENAARTHLLLPIRHVCPLSKLQLLGSKHADLRAPGKEREILANRPNISVTIVRNKRPVGRLALLVSVNCDSRAKVAPATCWIIREQCDRVLQKYSLQYAYDTFSPSRQGGSRLNTVRPHCFLVGVGVEGLYMWV